VRVRITFTKTGPLRYVGHLDLQTIWERAARRAGLPLAYSNGFHPQAKISFASALPLGFSSRAEVMDMRLQADLELSELPSRLQKALPAGISVLDATSMDDAEPALQVQIRSAEYEVSLVEGSGALELQAAIERVLAASNLPRERRGKAYDLRPLIEQLSMVPGSRTVIFMQLAAREGATGRPEEVLAELGIPSNSTRIERTRLIFQ
jgi:radical SAM-linked protein